MSEKIMFIVPNAMGHIHPAFGLARILAKKGYSILFAVPHPIHQYVVKNGFRCISLDGLPFATNGENFMDMTNKEFRIGYLDNLIDRLYDKLYNARENRMLQLVEEHRPDIILLDSFQSSDFLILYKLLKKYNIKFGFIQIMLSFIQQPKSLPLDCCVIPDETTDYDKHWKRYYARRFFKDVSDRIIFMGKSNLSMIKDKFKKNGIPLKYSISTKQVFRVGFNNIPELITTPFELEFTNHKQHYQQYLGSVIDHERKETYEPSFISFFDQIDQTSKIIFCSLGTVYTVSNKSSQINQFFTSLIDVAKKLKDYIFVVSLSKEYSAKLGRTPPNIHFFENVPQLMILSKTSVFITHGGSQSVKESIYNRVPMLAYPIWWDQPGFAARIAYYGLGLVGTLGTDNADQITEKINLLIYDKSFYDRLHRFSVNLAKNYTEDSILQKFEETFAGQIIE
ncbi:hypothetical protein DSL64_03860 [Dyadobacter luteus]|uniref:Glycosyl transferase n=1 Tax=Dyadobacter luteus TaxID=2259619 RepID=A0A3D8YFV7_9BACT|nr:glycosyltransferase [Dyadobacter luteus]REA63588.1 hypothetical protein DSL64_03860 [Dyadobacter luteus]